jgi:hypothetical protein
MGWCLPGIKKRGRTLPRRRPRKLKMCERYSTALRPMIGETSYLIKKYLITLLGLNCICQITLNSRRTIAAYVTT